MCSTNIKTPSASNPGQRKPTPVVVGTVEIPRGHGIGPSHTAQMNALNNKVQFEKTTHGAMEGQIKLQEKEKEYLCLKLQRLDRQLERAGHEHDVQLLKQYAAQQEIQVKAAEDSMSELYERHGVEYLYTKERARGKRRITEVDTPERGQSLSPPKAPRRPTSCDKLESSSNGSKISEDEKSSAASSQPDMVDLSDTSTDDDDEL